MKRDGVFKEKITSLIRFVQKQNVNIHAAHTAYFIVLSVFPLLVLLISLLRYTGLEVETLTEVLHGVVPDALLPAARTLIYSAYNSSTGTVVSLSAVIALWSASRGVYGLLCGLNAVYGVSENRGYLYTRVVSVAYTFAFLIVLLLTLMLHVFGVPLLALLPEQGDFWQFLSEIIDFRFFFLFFVQTALFTAVFTALPNKRNSFVGSLPGALLSSIGWLVFSDLYSIYVEHFAGYTNIFGSVYAVALSMLWLYSCVSIVFYGGVLNRWLSAEDGLSEA